MPLERLGCKAHRRAKKHRRALYRRRGSAGRWRARSQGPPARARHGSAPRGSGRVSRAARAGRQVGDPLHPREKPGRGLRQRIDRRQRQPPRRILLPDRDVAGVIGALGQVRILQRRAPIARLRRGRRAARKAHADLRQRPIRPIAPDVQDFHRQIVGQRLGHPRRRRTGAFGRGVKAQHPLRRAGEGAGVPRKRERIAIGQIHEVPDPRTIEGRGVIGMPVQGPAHTAVRMQRGRGAVGGRMAVAAMVQFLHRGGRRRRGAGAAPPAAERFQPSTRRCTENPPCSRWAAPSLSPRSPCACRIGWTQNGTLRVNAPLRPRGAGKRARDGAPSETAMPHPYSLQRNMPNHASDTNTERASRRRIHRPARIMLQCPATRHQIAEQGCMARQAAMQRKRPIGAAWRTDRNI